ncbi:MAG: NAD-dependent succinate-semialdehyde dehydrogenase [Bacillota bacterium]
MTKIEKISGTYVKGNWIERDNYFVNLNPATGEPLLQVSESTEEDVRMAIDAAEESLVSWRESNPSERAELLYRVYHRLIAHQARLAHIITLENGKPIKESMAEVSLAAGYFKWYAEEARRAYGSIVPENFSNNWRFVIYQSIGIVGVVTPWNFPLSMLCRKLAALLAAGCTAVVKPAKQTPWCAIELVKLLDMEGLPAGVLNLVCTSKPAECVDLLCKDQRVRKITFTGSSEVGKLIMRQASETLKRLSLELGGNAAFIVFPDVDLDMALNGLITAKFRNNGQSCIAANRILVHERIYDKFCKLLVEKVKTLRAGNGLDDGVDIGPIIDAQGFEKIQTQIEDSIRRGARLACGGNKIPSPPGSYFLQPCVLLDVPLDSIIFNKETFGPVIPVAKFSSEKEAVEIANRSPYGLACYIYTSNLGTALRMSSAIESGVIGVNDPLPSVPQCPFGGLKESGIGREGGSEGLYEFLETKYISLVL